MSADSARIVSVIVPTYHRADLLRNAVTSVLEQDPPEGADVEVIIAVSDPADATDMLAARELADGDERVRIATASAAGPGPARNAGLAMARGDRIAFMDDDCEAQRGWLRAGVARLDDFDLVQGKTWAMKDTSWLERSLWVAKETGLWESCNLFVRRSAIDRGGLFDEEWNPTGKPGHHWGEDTEWGWRLVRTGATHTFEERALVLHAVFKRSFREWLEYETKVRYFPLMMKEIPELEQGYPYGRFLSRRHIFLTAGAGLLATAGVVRLTGHPRLAAGVAVAAAVPVISPWRFEAQNALKFTLKEVIHFGALVYGSVRYRRVVL